MIKRINKKKVFGGKGELSNFHSVSLSTGRQREAMKMKNILRNKRVQISLALLIIFTVHTQVFTHLAFARSSGGGDLAKFDTGKFILSVGIGLASSVAGNVISSGVSSAATTGGSFVTGAGNALSSYGSFGSWASSYNSMAALNQLGAAISMTGQAEGWDVSTTTFVSSVAQGIVGGGLNPSSTLGAGGISNSTLKAMGVGAISGATEGAILANNVIRSNDSDIHGTQNPWVSAGANLAGAFVGGIASASMAAVIPEKGTKKIQAPSPSYQEYVKSGEPIFKKGPNSLAPDNLGSESAYNKIAALKTKTTAALKIKAEEKLISSETMTEIATWPVMVKTSTPVTTYHKAKTFGQVLTNGAVRAFSAIPSSAVRMGVGSITKDMDKQDAFMVKQAFSGAYPIVGTAYKSWVKDPVFERVGLENYVGQKNGALMPLHKEGVTTEPPPAFGNK